MILGGVAYLAGAAVSGGAVNVFMAVNGAAKDQRKNRRRRPRAGRHRRSQQHRSAGGRQ